MDVAICELVFVICIWFFVNYQIVFSFAGVNIRRGQFICIRVIFLGLSDVPEHRHEDLSKHLIDDCDDAVLDCTGTCVRPLIICRLNFPHGSQSQILQILVRVNNTHYIVYLLQMFLIPSS